MRDNRPILLVVGLLLAVVGVLMLVPAAIDVAVNNPDWEVFVAAGFVTGFVGAALALASRGGGTLTLQQAFLMTTSIWVVLPAFAALPFVFSELQLSFTDAYFEAMSGLTTTGSTVIVGLDLAPPGILMWRAMLQWLGGIGIIVIAIAVLPMLRVGGMQLFRMESTEKSKALPRAAQISGAIGVIYLTLSVLCMLAYRAAGMPMFDAVAHAMTTLATGGFSTFDASMGWYDSALIDAIATVFMIVGSLPFLLYFRAVSGDAAMLFTDSQVRWFFSILAVVIGTMSLWLIFTYEMSVGLALRYASFNVVSVITGTGYATVDFGLWGAFPVTLFFFVMIIGGCAGSTSCGIKVFRFQILYSTGITQIRRLLQPHGVFVPSFNRRPVPDAVQDSVMSFLFLFVLSYAVLAIALTLLGLDLITALSGAATALANVGPGLGEHIGPAGNFAGLPDAAKWLLSAGMLLGRLELFTVLVLFTPSFWRA